MAITIKIGSEPEKKVVTPKEIIDLKVLKNLNDDVMIFDHEDVTIVIQPKVKKVTAYAKDIDSDYCYGTQNRLFKFLVDKGLIDPATIQAGSVYASMEGGYFKDPKVNTIPLLLINIDKFIEEERPYFEFIADYNEMENDRLIEPDEKDSTELGEVPQAARKGSLSPNSYAYGNSFYYQSFTYE